MQYHACLHEKYELPVISTVLYPFETAVSQPPYVEVGGDGVLLTFDYTAIRLWEMEAQLLIDDRFVWLYSLLPAMKGANVPLLKQALREMREHYTLHQFGHHLRRFRTILSRSKTLSQAEKREMEEELRMRYKYDWFIYNDPDVLKRVSDAEQAARKEGLQEGLQEGLKEGLQEGKLEGELKGLRQLALRFVEERFAALELLVRSVIEHTANVEQLNQFILRISLARNEVEARQLLEQLESEAQPES